MSITPRRFAANPQDEVPPKGMVMRNGDKGHDAAGHKRKDAHHGRWQMPRRPMDVPKRKNTHGSAKRADKRLVAKTKPSTRHPDGMARCQRWKIRDGEFWQCPKAARPGYRVCGSHGVGYAKREREGRRQNAAVAAMRTGLQTKPETLAALFGARPELKALYDHELNSPNLLDLRPQLAKAKVLVDYFLSHAKLEDTDNSFGKTPPALAAAEAMDRLVGTAQRLLKVEESLGPITHAELKRYMDAIADGLIRFVPADRLEECRQYIRSRIVGGDEDFGGPP